MNYPNGMFYYNGYYHLYFQYNPNENTWGSMHWGHAVSKDMITWREQPIALYPDVLGDIWSGSIVMDSNNSAGFGKANNIEPIVSVFTYSKKDSITNILSQNQGIAYSLDEGRSFTKYKNNPVLKNPGVKDFRDPKISWDTINEKWIMILAAGDKTMFYSSKDLKKWELLSDFKKYIGNHEGKWECPDFFPLQLEGSEEIKWVLLVSKNSGGFNGGGGTQYFIGDFDGTRFTLDDNFKKSLSKNKAFWIDYGRDNYAGVTWSNIAATDGRRLFLGWMSNWDYALKVPTKGWRSSMTIPRELKLVKNGNGYLVSSIPVKELGNYREKKYKRENITIKGEVELINSKMTDLSSVEIKFNIRQLGHGVYTFKFSNKEGDVLLFGYEFLKNQFFINRINSGRTSFSEKFGNTTSIAPRVSKSKNLAATVILDKTSIELFFDNGKTVMTETFFPNAPFERLTILTENQEVILDDVEVNQLIFE
ncbi:glycoside hydrolase family 32 protein [Flavobacterium sp. ZE23DGlu08]|uniref:glycoside hydrolase family 32 protein n=1 Tax=Flavobacterium sp. ZE23DGlu08 TaxID=3059026 RepID=UPI00265E4482|nr:glycoside hydrolase family 32 protein [Flavobacterium sp. ZE23DGlu08]WKL43726.1 glycoside hydrolase family 32 protein [Flavobacterium sp. ZE23DGlu08]